MLVMSTGGFNELLPETEEEEGPSCEGWLSAWFPGLPPTNGLRFAYAATGHEVRESVLRQEGAHAAWVSGHWSCGESFVRDPPLKWSVFRTCRHMSALLQSLANSLATEALRSTPVNKKPSSRLARPHLV